MPSEASSAQPQLDCLEQAQQGRAITALREEVHARFPGGRLSVGRSFVLAGVPLGHKQGKTQRSCGRFEN
jgi:hypothetical protein